MISSSLDPASVNMANNIIEITSCELMEKSSSLTLYYCEEIKSQLLIIDSDLIYLDNLPRLKHDPRRLIFLSRHSSASRTLSLLIHFTGNWTNEAKYGGKPSSLGISDPILGKIIFNSLSKTVIQENMEHIPISLEATHHGPSELDKPLVFVEIGSDLDAWKNKKLGYLWAITLIESIKKLLDQKYGNYVTAIGFGGPHYVPNFTEIERKTRIAMSHIAPKYVIDDIDKQIVSQAITRSETDTKLAIIDWKGLNSKQRKKILQILDTFTELEVARARNVLSNEKYHLRNK